MGRPKRSCRMGKSNMRSPQTLRCRVFVLQLNRASVRIRRPVRVIHHWSANRDRESASCVPREKNALSLLPKNPLSKRIAIKHLILLGTGTHLRQEANVSEGGIDVEDDLSSTKQPKGSVVRPTSVPWSRWQWFHVPSSLVSWSFRRCCALSGRCGRGIDDSRRLNGLKM